MSALADVAVPAAFAGLRRFALDGAVLLFDRDSGLCVRCEDASTAGIRQVAPVAVQFAITNHCNLRCGFCSRDAALQSQWTEVTAFDMLAALADAGVLEVAFGGGEPLVFAGFDRLLGRLYDETPLAASLTTNGTLLDRARVRSWHDEVGRPRYGQIRVSLYDDQPWRATLTMLADAGARFGVNLLITPDAIATLQSRVLELAALGCRDVLLLAYNGHDRSMHVAGAQATELARRVRDLAAALRGHVAIKLDVCWGARMAAVPRLRPEGRCAAGREFMVVTSDLEVMPCSFHELALPFRDAAGALAIWRDAAQALGAPASRPGCARRADYGLGGFEVAVDTLVRRREVSP